MFSFNIKAKCQNNNPVRKDKKKKCNAANRSNAFTQIDSSPDVCVQYVNNIFKNALSTQTAEVDLQKEKT